MVRFAFVCALLAGASASAQTTLTITPNKFGFQDCKDRRNVTIQWDFGTTFVTGQSVAVLLTTDSNCGTTAGAPSLSPNQTQSGTINVEPSAFLFNTKATDCVGDVKSSNPTTIYVCARWPATGTASGQAIQPVKFALAPPLAPVSLTKREGDQHVRLAWEQGDATEQVTSYDVFVRPVSDLPGGVPPSPGGDAGTNGDEVFAGVDPSETAIADRTVDISSIKNVGALANDVEYAFAVRATDAYGNVSGLSEVITGTPKPIDDFYTHYRDSGGQAGGGGGCSTLGPAGWIIALLGVALLMRRRKPGALLLLLATGLATPSFAQAEKLLKSEERAPRRMLFALKIDRYDPQIDTEGSLAGATPYHDIFHGRAPLRWQLEGNWEVAHPFGTLMLGATVGYWQNIGKGLDHLTQLPSEDTALLDVLPFGLIATWRFDWAADRHNIPVIPYAQLGLQAALWASFNGRGDVVSRPSGGRGSGWTTGTTAALGVALPLDWLDPSLSREAYNDVRLQRTSLFAEYGWSHLTSFGKSGALILSDRAWRFGLALEF